MPNTLIIPCGTSQIDKEKLSIIEVDAITQQVVDNTEKPLECREDIYLLKDTVSSSIDVITNKLGNYHLQRHELVPFPYRDDWYELNPYGAELSTLIRLENNNQNQIESNRLWNIKEDQIVLLASETRAGLLSRRVIEEYLCKFYQTPVPVEKTIFELKEYQNYPLTAMKNLVKAVCTSLIASTAANGNSNFILITGGFKSVIPCLTMIALMYGLELIYLFEKSTNIERMRFVSQFNEEQNKMWRDFWINLQKRGWLSQETVVIRSIVDQWKDDKDQGRLGPIFG
jgi:putative CRISPR-associated protein (TIGR02619 family)